MWLHGGGDFLDFDLAPGQRLIVDTGCMVMIEPTVKYEVKMQGGLKKSLFGGEGFFLVQMTGPAMSPCRRCRSRAPRAVSCRPRAAGATRASAWEASSEAFSAANEESQNKEVSRWVFSTRRRPRSNRARRRRRTRLRTFSRSADLSQTYTELGKTTFELIESGEISNPQLAELAEKIRGLKEKIDGGDEVLVGATAGTSSDEYDDSQPPAMPS